MHDPYGGKLVNRILPDKIFAERVRYSSGKSISLNLNKQTDLINIATGCYSPLEGFMTEEEYFNVLNHSCLPTGLNWTVPIILPTEKKNQSDFRIGEKIALTNQEGSNIGLLSVKSIYRLNFKKDAKKIFGTSDETHPGVINFFENPSLCLGGDIFLIEKAIPSHRYYATPKAVRDYFSKKGFKTVTAFSTRNICHLGHEHLHHFALEATEALGINVITGAHIKGKFRSEVIFDTYEYLLETYYPKDRVFLNNMRIPPLYAGPKEAFHQALMLQNIGFTHFIVGRDHAGIEDYYPKYGSQKIFEKHTNLDIEILAFSEPRYCTVCGKVTTEKSCRHKGKQVKKLSGRDVKSLLLEEEFKKLSYSMRDDLLEYITKSMNRNIESPGYRVRKNGVREILLY